MSQKCEYDIHNIIKNYPYILGDEFKNLTLKHEKVYCDRTRADFVFANNSKSIVVEVKKGYIDAETIEQATHYLDNERKENPSRVLKGILVGYGISDKQEFDKILQNSEYEFEVKFLDIDVPTQIQICDRCRKANKLSAVLCKYCGSNKFIRDPFLFSK